jgi:hypothetical protein
METPPRWKFAPWRCKAWAWAAEGFVERGLVLRPFRPAVPFKAFLLFRRISSAPVW